MITLAVDEAFLDRLEEDVARIGNAVMDGVETAVQRASEVVAHAARADHPYTDRTGALSASIEALPAVRVGEVVRGGVLAGAEYAEHVERSHPFLAPALDASLARIEQETDQVLHEAIRGARA